MHFLRTTSTTGKARDTIPHSHLTGTCPVTGQTHEWCPPQPGDSRSPCPALNTMANHGYIHRSGKGITFIQIAKALAECYGIGTFFSYFLAIGGLLLLRQWGPICLADIARHGAVEHDASLAHQDTHPGDVYAPLEVDEELLDDSMACMTEEGDGFIDAQDVARVRVHREKYSLPLKPTSAEIARGEMAIPLLMFAPKGCPPGSAPADYIREWIGDERLPEGGTWRPVRSVGIFAVVKMTKGMKKGMAAIRKAEGGKADAGVLYEPPASTIASPPKAGSAAIPKPPKYYGSISPSNGRDRQESGGSASSSVLSTNDDLLSSGRPHERQDTSLIDVDVGGAKVDHK